MRCVSDRRGLFGGGFRAKCFSDTVDTQKRDHYLLDTNVSLYWKSLTAIVLAVGAWIIVPLGVFFQKSEDAGSHLNLYLLASSVFLSVISMYIGHTLRFYETRIVRIGHILAKLYLQVFGVLLAISIVLSYMGK